MIQLVVCVAILGGAAGAGAQAPEPGAPAPTSRLERALGEVTAVDIGARRLVLKTDTGETVTVHTDDKTAFLRAQPGARDLAGATPATLGDIAVGDRLLARGVLGTDKSLSARQVVVMARADIAQKHAKDQADWSRRGVSGVITAIDPARQEVTVEARTLTGSQPVIVSTDRKPTFKRYAPESVRFSDARPSSFAELQVGDQLRVLGDRSPDGAKVMAEQVVSGSFQILSGAVKTVEGGTVTIVDNETGRPLAIAVGPDAMVRRLPPEMAARLAMRGRGPGGPGRPGAPGGWQGRRAAGAPGGRPDGAEPPDGGRMGAQTLQDMLDRLPALPLGELKPRDQVAVSSTKGSDPARVTAVVLLAGIEPLLQSRPSTASGGETLGLAAGALDIGLGVP